MITLIEALNFRSLRYVSQPLGGFHILVGPNASGKTTFLDVIAFLSQLISTSLDFAVAERARNVQELFWQKSGNRFELAIEAVVPEHILKRYEDNNKQLNTIRYEVAIGNDNETGQVAILEERVLLKTPKFKKTTQRTLFPAMPELESTLISKGTRNILTVVNKVKGGNDYFRTELFQDRRKSWQYAFKLGPQKSALGSLPADETQFPATTWLKNLLTEGVQPFVLNSLLIRKSSPPGQGKGFKPDGSNLPWVIEDLRTKYPEKFSDWISHIRSALPDVEDVYTIERPDDRSRYLVLRYQGGLEVPSWVVSDGTLRLLALTLPAYLPDLSGIFLIEEPENGIHPRAVETVFQSLSSVYNAQILLASHSPILLGIAKAENILCFAKIDGATDIVAGNEHPALSNWQGEVTLGDLFAAGVLG